MKTDLNISTMQQKLPQQYFKHAIKAFSTRRMRNRRAKNLLRKKATLVADHAVVFTILGMHAGARLKP